MSVIFGVSLFIDLFDFLKIQKSPKYKIESLRFYHKYKQQLNSSKKL